MKTIKKQKTDLYTRVAMLLLESPLGTISMMKMRNRFEQKLYQLWLNKIGLVREYHLYSKQHLSLLEMEYTKKKEYLESKINFYKYTRVHTTQALYFLQKLINSERDLKLQKPKKSKF